MTLLTRRSAVLLVAALGAVTAGACGSSSSGDKSKSGGASSNVAGVSVSKQPKLAATLPKRIRDAGVIRVASNAPYAPFVRFKTAGSKEFAGSDVDLAKAAGAVLGVRVSFSQLPFDGLIPAVKAGKYDAVMGGVTDNREREKVLDFVDYNVTGLKMLVRAGNPQKITSLGALCGKSVSAQASTDQAAKLDELNKTTCKSNKLSKVAVPQEPDAQLAVKSGRAAAEMTGSLVAVDAAKKNPQAFSVANDPSAPQGYQAEPNAIGVRKEDTALRDGLQKAIQQLIDDGSYLKLLRPYNMGFTAIKKATVNDARR